MTSRQEASERANPKHGREHVERGAKIDAQVQKAQAARRTEMAKRPVVNPSANAIPGLTNRPKLALPPSLKKQG
jgi:hypothetical protein